MPTYKQYGNNFTSFNLGFVHYVLVNYDQNSTNNEQFTGILNWLESDLQASNTQQQRA